MSLLIEYQEWQASLITLAILWYIVFIVCGSLVAYYLCKNHNKWGIVLFSFTLTIIGTIFSLFYFYKNKSVD